MTLHEALVTIVMECGNQTARIFASSAMEVKEVYDCRAVKIANEENHNSLRSVIQPILDNLDDWKGVKADEVKAVLKQRIE